jgi:hypothetical protein
MEPSHAMMQDLVNIVLESLGEYELTPLVLDIKTLSSSLCFRLCRLISIHPRLTGTAASGSSHDFRFFRRPRLTASGSRCSSVRGGQIILTRSRGLTDSTS